VAASQTSVPVEAESTSVVQSSVQSTGESASDATQTPASSTEAGAGDLPSDPASDADPTATTKASDPQASSPGASTEASGAQQAATTNALSGLLPAIISVASSDGASSTEAIEPGDSTIDPTNGYSVAAISASQDPAAAATFIAGGQTYTVQQASSSGGGVNIAQGGSTVYVPPGSTAAVAGQSIAAAGSGAVIVGSQIIALSGQQSQGPSVISVVSQPGVAIAVVVTEGGVTAALSAGGSEATLNGQVISAVQSDGSVVVVGSAGNTLDVAAATQGTTAQTVQQSGAITLGGQTYTFVSLVSGGSDAVLGNAGATTTLALGAGEAVTIDGEVLSLNAANQLVADPTNVVGSGTQATQITVGSNVVTASPISGGEVLVDGTSRITLSAGGAGLTIDGKVVSEASGGLVVRGSTVITAPGMAATTIPMSGTQATLLTVGSAVITASEISSGEVVLEHGTSSITLSAGGPPQTIDGQVVSEASDGLVLESSTATSTAQITKTSSSGVSTSTGSLSSIEAQAPAASSTSSKSAGNKCNAPLWLSAAVMIMATIMTR
jgi:RNase P/RNase MRP subunit p29